ncbi:translation initiation factor eIF-2B subunit epsilon [Anopheles bellator]|uniref:translation initiation factor eIF-2B subunit epsilon n=1 Tax=Anopheles bellator TaxID=139047 RepID=UPI0026478204|nr:translation initiation factor eIF-2B subunit epsilon [Anopheles bellator]
MSKSMDKKEVRQAIIIGDSYNENFQPFTGTSPLALLPIVNVPLVDFTLETLSRNGVEEVIMFCSNHIGEVKRYIQQRQSEKCTWSINMSINIISSTSCRNLGEALRDLDAKHIIRGNVLLLGIESITNANLALLLDEHKRLMKVDNGAVMTIALKEGVPGMRTGNELVIAVEPSTRRLLFHQRLTQQQTKDNFELPLEMFLTNRDVTVCHGILDPQIAVCSHMALPLFADNFDFLTRDDFVRGVLINEEILNSRIYVSKLAREEYAMRVNNWQSYQMVSLDVINRWVYPLVPDMGISQFLQYYKCYRNNIYRHGDVRLARSSKLVGDLVIDKHSSIDEDTYIHQSTIGKNCTIGKGCRIENSFLFEGAKVGDGCVLNHCLIGTGALVGSNCNILDGTVLGANVEIPAGMKIVKLLVQATAPESEWAGVSKKLADRAFTVPDEQNDEDSNSDDENEANLFDQPTYLSVLQRAYSPSIYEPSDEESESGEASPVQEDANIFLSEVVESLKRGFAEQTNAEYLILEINSSRYAYNMSLSEVNFYVVKAILQILMLQENVQTNTVATLRKILGYFGVVVKNYIRDKDAMLDCLKAFEEMSQSNETIRSKIAQLVHYLYESDLVREDVIIEWHGGLDDESLKKALCKLVDWLNESSDEDGEEDDE